MIVEAVRDDGALLITDGPAAAIVSDDGVWITLRSSALARGEWLRDSRPLPDSLPDDLEQQLARKRTEDENPPSPADERAMSDLERRAQRIAR